MPVRTVCLDPVRPCEVQSFDYFGILGYIILLLETWGTVFSDQCMGKWWGGKNGIMLAHSLDSRGLSWYVSRFPGRLCPTGRLALLTRVGIATTTETERMFR